MIREKILNFFLSRYSDSSFIVRQKVSLLIWFHIILLPVAVLYVIINIFRNNPRELAGIFALDFGFIIALSAGLILIKKQKFNAATVLDIAVVTLLTIGGHFIKSSVQIETGYNGFAVLMYGVLVFTVLFSSRRVQSLVFVIFFILTFSFHFFSLKYTAPSVHINLFSATLNNILILIVIFILSYNNRIITDRALKLAQHELEINTELSRSLEQKVEERTSKLAEEREILDAKNRELEDIKNTLLNKNNELETAKQSAEDANNAKNRFLATLSHELRTPLNGIIGISDLMLERNISRENMHTLQMIKQSGENLFFIIQDLLDFTTIENNQISIKNGFFSIDDLIEHITVGLKDQIKNKNLLFTVKVTPDNAVVYSDKTRMAQIIINLVTNSIKYTRSGSINLSVNINHNIRITVDDTGIGIDSDKIDTIFDAFTRIESDYVKSQTGLGLGLSIVNQIVKMMNGSIRVVSKPGEGSTFTIEIPLEKNSAETDRIESSKVNDYSIIQGKKILIVEDNAINRFYFNTVLKKSGAEVDEALNGREALRLNDTFKYDIILMDLNMPDFDGLLLTRIIRGTDNPNSKTLITALSAHAYRDHIQMCIDAGMNDFISKPVEREQFLSTISSLLKSAVN